MDKNKALIQLSESKNTDYGKKDFKDQSEIQKVFSTIWEVEAQVNNGGFSQYFFNSSSETAFFLVAALEKLEPVKWQKFAKRL
ncbi:PF14300 domain protein [Leptospira noguchii serovar Autumnalis str. ZUN142]|uniref:PF14300 domain protein n=1 Tax=Leptospira noguchii serovar Autumnalis str. ZUN142 TaxID=1085540 RepID=M6UB58_9LEPT|nr:PF14300 domain protein [Leptospira noguchii serovar Autumnalis str. ZUN142]